ncbi:hypothetical protein PV328_011976 [Microctonus aethiopoides]|uniref:THAP-type domain-containing protein n=1 Tax=Microctonus aethiopoides TaxID=144406 RepID=A0AA39C331_9HYME|nr:hypothetical protein PV328_011976 [Microctonus aethiopoides]
MNKTRLYCAVPDCKSKASVNVDLSYHRFPLSDKYNENVTNYFGDVEKVGLYSQWKKVTNIPNPGPNDRICSQHFTAADYCGNGVRNQRRRLKYNAIPSLHLPIINKERNERNEKRHARVEMRALNAQKKRRYDNNVPEPMQKDIEISESVQSTIEAGEDFEMVQMVIEGNAANILPKVSISEDVGVQATIENDSRDVEVQATIENDARDFEIRVQSGELVYKFTDFIKNDAQLSTMTGIENFEILTCIENLTSVLYISKNDSRVRMCLRDKIVMTFIKLYDTTEHQAVDAAGGAVDDDADDEDGKLKRRVGDAEAGDARRSGDTGRAGEAEAGDAEVGDAERVGNAERRRPRLIVINHYRLGHTSNLGGGL